MISTYHPDETVVGKKKGRDLVKPVAVLDYNNTMGGVDLKDQKLSACLLERKRCVKWYMKIFKRLLNVSVLNAFILLTESISRRGKPELLHRSFREQLADSLVARHRRSSPQVNPGIDMEDLRLRRDLVHVPELTTGRGNRMNCRICARNGKDKKVHLKCATCDEAMCPGDCWRVWHSLQQLPGRDIKSRKGRRRH
ncbi:unnamed protein product [Parnassius apollo]|uniref:(apollo) hypothetical protein n=1 Tax=Parnassius apollo TaxID=110799 RepID=A0A8S3XK89_PARAO|nr:unnamed protein product [Parnassius apollo]